MYDVTRAETFDSLADIWLREVGAGAGVHGGAAGSRPCACCGPSRLPAMLTHSLPSFAALPLHHACVTPALHPWRSPPPSCTQPTHPPLLPAPAACQVDMYNTVEEGIKMVVANKTDLVGGWQAPAPVHLVSLPPDLDPSPTSHVGLKNWGAVSLPGGVNHLEGSNLLACLG